ncbi:MAG: phage head morphogenesis protein [Sodalis sp. (in: enterobacteria)]|uniref:phage head morphogenesis protein n=1 Tax=Sodalis sp. (in: enterobacteria) TaxID=1898979 RepID=UPI003F2FDE68
MAALSVAHTPTATEQALEDAPGGLTTPVNQTMQTLLTPLVSALQQGQAPEAVTAMLADSLRHGKTLTQFQDEVLPLLQRKGWLGKGLKASADGELEGKKLLPYRLETIFRTNTQSAYMAGRYQRLRENVDQRPYWQYVAVMDSHTRPGHAARHGRVFRYDDAGWDTLFPLNGYNCRCRVRALTADQLARHSMGLESTDDYRVRVDQPQGVNGKTRLVTGLKDPKTGHVFTPDAGFHLNPGEGYLSHLGEQLLDRDTGNWVSQVVARQQTRGDVRPVGALRPAVVDALSCKGVVPDSAVITLTDANLLHATRDSKQGTLPTTADYLLGDPGIIAAPAARNHLRPTAGDAGVTVCVRSG